MDTWFGPILMVLIATSVFVFISYLLSRKKAIYGFIFSGFLFGISGLLLITGYGGSNTGFDGLVAVLLGFFFLTCAILTTIFTFIFNGKKIFKQRHNLST